MLSIHLHNLQFFSHHGIYEDEKILGNEFEVNITVKHSPKQLPVKHLSETIDYISVYELVKKRMQQREALLETLAMDITNLIYAEFKNVKEVGITIIKITPPFENFSGKVGVTYNKVF